MSHCCVSGTTRTTACCMNASTMAFVPKEDPEGMHSSLKVFPMIILTHTFSRHEPKHLLVPRVEKAKCFAPQVQVLLVLKIHKENRVLCVYQFFELVYSASFLLHTL